MFYSKYVTYRLMCIPILPNSNSLLARVSVTDELVNFKTSDKYDLPLIHRVSLLSLYIGNAPFKGLWVKDLAGWEESILPPLIQAGDLLAAEVTKISQGRQDLVSLALEFVREDGELARKLSEQSTIDTRDLVRVIQKDLHLETDPVSSSSLGETHSNSSPITPTGTFTSNLVLRLQEWSLENSKGIHPNQDHLGLNIIRTNSAEEEASQKLTSPVESPRTPSEHHAVDAAATGQRTVNGPSLWDIEPGKASIPI